MKLSEQSMMKKGINGIWNLASPCPKNNNNNVPNTMTLSGRMSKFHCLFLMHEIMEYREERIMR